VGASGDRNGRGAGHVFSIGALPFEITTSGNSIDENNLINAPVLLLSATPSTSGPFTFAFASGTGGEDNSSFTLVGAQLRAAQVFNHESKSVYHVKIRATDAAGRSVTKPIQIQVNNVNEPPTAITRSTNRIPELNQPGDLVATLGTADPDAGDTFTYSLVSGVGDFDNAHFSISGNRIYANKTFDFETQNRYTIRVRSQDAGGLAVEAPVPFSIIDSHPPARPDSPRFDLRLVADINPTQHSSDPTEAVTIGGVTYFAASTALEGAELWRSDGTASGTIRVADLNPGAASTSPRNLFAFNGQILFIGDYHYVDPQAPSGGYGYWRVGLFTSDGTPAGTTLLSRLDHSEFESSSVNWEFYATRFTAVAGKAFFLVRATLNAEPQLWTTDGTVAGTKLVKQLPPNPFSDSLPEPIQTATLGNKFLFNLYVSNQTGSHELWASDGSSAGTIRLRQGEEAAFGPDFFGSSSGKIVTAGSKAYFTSYSLSAGRELWVTDGTVPGTHLVRDINTGEGGAGINNMVPFSGGVFFTTESFDHGRQLWRSNGTTTGTYQLTQDSQQWSSSVFSDLAVLGDNVYFAGNDADDGIELWKSDGTVAGTQPVYSYPGMDGLYPQNFVSLGNRLGFQTHTFSPVGGQFWSTDGTANGTQFVTHAQGSDFVNSGVNTFFRSASAGTGSELWITDGTPAGTRLVKDIFPGAGSGADKILAPTASGVAFRGTSATGTEIGFSDGTDTGTFLVDIASGTQPADIHEFIKVGDVFYVATQQSLVRTDGTPNGTIVLAQFGQFDGPRKLTQLGNDVYFTAQGHSNQGRELWKSDGTVAGTKLYKDIHPGSGSSDPDQFVKFEDRLYFTANDGVNGRELWRLDFGDARAVLHTQFVTGPGDGQIDLLQVHNGRLYAIANGQLRVSTGGNFTSLAATRGRSLMPWGDVIYFSGYTEEHGSELWRTDGTTIGTYLVQDLWPGPESSDPGGGVVLDGIDTAGGDTIDAKLLFRAVVSSNYSQLWATDGTTAGTRQLTDYPVVTGSYGGLHAYTPIELTRYGNYVLFEAFTPAEGRELWISDGTVRGTKLFADLRPGELPSLVSDGEDVSYQEYWDQRIKSLTPFRDKLFFHAGDRARGQELWYAVPDRNIAGQAIDILEGPMWLTSREPSQPDRPSA
jgi:trimeric autotransporter adhesin